MAFYTLMPNGETPLPCDAELWKNTIDANRRVAITDLGERGVVSTVFLGIDHAFNRHGPPVLWETMIFNGPFDQAIQWRYTSRRAAQSGHDELVERLRGMTLDDCETAAAGEAHHDWEPSDA